MAVGDDILGRILSSTHRVVLLRGPAASGKTTAAVATYRHFNSPAASRCLLVAPNAPAAESLKRLLLAEALGGVLVSPAVTTFASLANKIVSAGVKPKRPLPALQRYVMLQRIIAELAAAGKLTALGRVADTPGLVEAVDKAIAELKRAALEPAALEAALASQGRGGGKARDLLHVYRAYQERLVAAGVYDLEGLHWEAREVLATADVLGDVEAIVVDGFTDFTPTQLDILERLSRRLARVVITLPCADDNRLRMWRWTRRTLTAIRGRFGAELTEIDLAAPPSLAATLVGSLFEPDAPPHPLPPGLRVIAASGMDAEVSAAAARVKRLLLGGESPGRIAVLARSMESYRPAIERVFRRDGLPVAAAPAVLTDVPVIRFLLDAASLGPQFDFQQVLAVVKSSYFRPAALGDFPATAAAVAEMIIREGNVVEGAAAYSDAAQRLARRIRPTDDDDEGTLELGPLAASREDILAAGAMLQALFTLVGAAAVDAATQDADAAHPLATLAAGLHLRQAAAAMDDAELLARDLRALDALGKALGALSPPWSDLAHLRQALAAVTCPPPRGESVVDVLDVLDARSLRYRHVFLLGASEGEFPSRFSQGSLLGEADRQAYARHNIVLDSRSDLTSREMLLFYLAASRADAQLTVSYLESDASGAPGAASPFLLALLEPFGGLAAMEQTPAFTRIPQGRFIPPAEEIASPQAALDAAMAYVFGAEGGDARAFACAAAQQAPLLDRIAQGLFARDRRWRSGPCDAYDGRLSDTALHAALAERFGPQAVYSASQLNTYGQCPWQFFASYVLHLSPLAQPQRLLEPVTRGSFCHDVLFTLMTALARSRGTPVKLADVSDADLDAALDAAIEEESRRIALQRPPYPVLWDLQRAGMRQELRQYLRLQRQSPTAGGVHFELGFGLGERVVPEMQDPASSAAPVAIDTPAGSILLRGKIDRLDRAGAGAREGLLVIDYKTGALPKPADIVEGRNLQLPLYTLAAATLLGADCLGGAFHRIGKADKREQYFAAVKPDGGQLVANDKYETDSAAAIASAAEAVTGMRSGRFDLSPAGKCPSYCPFRLICHISDARRAVKNPPAEEAPA